MAKYAGLVGYVTEEETSPGIWSPVENARKMRGDILRLASVSQGTDIINENVTLQHRVSVVGDAYSFSHYYEIKWIELRGIKWEVTMITVERPRLILTLGRIWNG